MIRFIDINLIMRSQEKREMPIECIGILKSGRTLAKTNAKTKLKV